jgi:hypothetical protein
MKKFMMLMVAMVVSTAVANAGILQDWEFGDGTELSFSSISVAGGVGWEASL